MSFFDAEFTQPMIALQNKVGIRPQKSPRKLGDVKFLMMGVTVLKRMADPPCGRIGGRESLFSKREGEI